MTRTSNRTAATAGLLLLGLLPASAAAADVAAGRAAAERWCAACHVVSAGQATVAEGPAPTFAAVATRLDDEALAAFVTEPHPPMAPLALTRREVADLVAYIRSQAP